MATWSAWPTRTTDGLGGVRLTRRGWECVAFARAGIAQIEAEWAGLIGTARLDDVKEALEALNDALAVEPSWPRAQSAG